MSASRPNLLVRRAVAGAVAAAFLLASACSDDDSSAAGEAEESTTSSRPTTTESNSDTGSPTIEQQIQALLHSYDSVTRDIANDPEIAGDPRSPQYDELRALMTPDSDMIGAVINALVARGAQGVSQRSQGDAELPVERLVEGEIREVRRDEFVVPICVHLNYGLFNSDNQQTELVRERVEPAEATVVRVDGELRIQRFESLEEGERCTGERQ